MAGGFGSRYHGTTTTQTPGGFGSRAQAPAAAKKEKHRGILGEVGHVVGQTGADLYHAAVNTPAGVYYLGKGLATDPIGTVKQVVSSTVEDLRHPLRHPGYTLLDVLGLASAGAGTAARAAAVGGKLAEGAKVGEVARAALAKPRPGPRVHQVGDMKVQADYARPVLARAAQKGTDKLLKGAHAKNPTGKLGRTYEKRVNKALVLNTRLETAAQQGPASALLAMGRKLKPHEQAALKVVANEAPIADRIAVTRQRIAASSGAELKRHEQRLANLEKAAALVTDGKPVLKPHLKKLQHVYDRMAAVATSREELLKQIDSISQEGIQQHKTDVGRVALGATYEKPTPGKLGKSATLDAAVVERDRLAAIHEKALNQEAKWHGETAMGGVASHESLASVKKAHPNVQIDANEADHGITLSMIKTAEEARGSGHASRAMKDLVNYADRKGKPIALTPEAVGKAGLSKAELRKWYAGLGFRRNAGAAKDFNFRESMIRPPKPIGVRASNPYRNRIVQIGTRLEAANAKVDRLTEATGKRVKPTGIVGAEHFTASPEAVYVPEKVTRRGSKSLTRQPVLGGQGTIGHAQAPKSLTAGYTGGAARHALERQDTTTLVAEANLEAQKYAGAIHLRDTVKGAGHAVPQSPDDVFVRLDKLKAHDATPLPVRQFIDNPGEAFVPVDQRQQHFADFVKNTFVRPRDMTPADRAAFEKLAADGKGVWVSKTILGDWAKPQAPLSSVLGKKTVGTVDAINNASRFAILYLKPAYLAPNLLGNVTLNLIQQGPVGLALSLRKTSTLSFKHPELAARIDALMGEGIAKSVTGDSGALNSVVQGGANAWSRVVDVAFRRSAFVYEARKAGFKSPADIERLLTGGHHDELLGVSRRANREIIDYGRLGNKEKEIVRRVVFFYPWAKGSTMYAGHLAVEHPVTTAGLGQVGKTGREQTVKDLGPLPSYLEGIFPVGKNRVVNPASAAILQTPAQVGAALAGLATGDVSKVAELSNFLTPAASLAAAEVFRRSPTGYAYPGGTSGPQIAKDVLSSRLPQVTAYNRIQDARHGKGQNRLYPPNVLDALLQYGVGGLAPRTYNPSVLSRLYQQEQSQIRSGR